MALAWIARNAKVAAFQSSSGRACLDKEESSKLTKKIEIYFQNREKKQKDVSDIDLSTTVGACNFLHWALGHLAKFVQERCFFAKREM